MKKIKAIAVALLIANSFWSCEKDDICPDGSATTPSLIVEFYNKDNRTEPKSANLKYYAVGMETKADSIIGTRLELPLKTNEDITKWALILRTQEMNELIPNTDFIEFKYTRRDEYISRACGYKTVFTLNTDTEAEPNPVLSDTIPPDNLWIQSFSVEQPNIIDENEVHFKIYF